MIESIGWLAGAYAFFNFTDNQPERLDESWSTPPKVASDRDWAHASPEVNGLMGTMVWSPVANFLSGQAIVTRGFPRCIR